MRVQVTFVLLTCKMSLNAVSFPLSQNTHSAVLSLSCRVQQSYTYLATIQSPLQRSAVSSEQESSLHFIFPSFCKVESHPQVSFQNANKPWQKQKKTQLFNRKSLHSGEDTELPKAAVQFFGSSSAVPDKRTAYLFSCQKQNLMLFTARQLHQTISKINERH